MWALVLQRLKTRAQFQAVLAGATVARSEHFALHRKLLIAQPKIVNAATGPSHEVAGFVALKPAHRAEFKASPDEALLFRGGVLWLGAMVPKRWAKRAVTRNAIKRQIYDVSQGFFSKQEAAFVVRLRRDFSRQHYLSASSAKLKQDVRSELLSLMHQASQEK